MLDMRGQLNVRLPDELLERLRDTSIVTGVSRSRLVRDALEAMLVTPGERTLLPAWHATKSSREGSGIEPAPLLRVSEPAAPPAMPYRCSRGHEPGGPTAKARCFCNRLTDVPV